MVAGTFQPSHLSSIRGIRIEIPWTELTHANLYLIEDSPLTLVDAGANTPRALEGLESGLRDLGYRFEDIERVLITHQHADHVGLARQLKDRAEAEFVTGPGLAEWLRDPIGRRAWEIRYQYDLLIRHGAGPDTAERNIAYTLKPEVWYEGFEVDLVVTEGDQIEFADRTISAWSRPGHSPHDTVFLDETNAVLFGGDHLIDFVASNPLITPAPGTPVTERPPMVELYRRSLSETAAMDLDVILSGHGKTISDHPSLIKKRLARMEERTAGLLELVRRSGPITAFQAVRDLWPWMAETSAYFALSELLGYVDVLVDSGVMREVEDAGVVFLDCTA